MVRIHTFVLTAVVLVLPAAASLHAAPLVLQWTGQLGAGDLDESTGVSADSLGNVYISGYNNDSLGGPHAGDNDVFVAKYAIPEPSSGTLALLGLAALGLLAARRRLQSISGRRASSHACASGWRGHEEPSLARRVGGVGVLPH